MQSVRPTLRMVRLSGEYSMRARPLPSCVALETAAGLMDATSKEAAWARQAAKRNIRMGHYKPGDKHRDESRRGTHECVRHITLR